MKIPTRQEAEDAVGVLLRWAEGSFNEMPLREGIRETPKRVAKSFAELFSGYREHPAEHMKVFPYEEGQGTPNSIVLLKDIEFSSTCEHHMQPFLGTAHIAYIPGPHGVLGASKLVRVLEVYTRRLQIQERIGEQVADALFQGVPGCVGSAVVLEARHLCIACRGVRKQNSVMVTSALRGVFMKEPETRAELMAMIRSS